ncbi:MAG: sialate O-acetylesterase [Alistipes sp.]
MKKFLLIVIALFAGWSVSAKVELPEMIGDNMVLQQNTSATLWGWASPRASVTAEASWGARATVKSDNDGRWTLQLKTPEGSYEPQQITLVSGDKVVLNNVLIGEVWLGGGQSNMEMSLVGYHNCPAVGAAKVIALANTQRNKIRYVRINRVGAYTPQERVAGRWNAFTPQTAAGCTAVGYYFASMLNQALDVPVGIIDCAWGGSMVECWMNRESLENYPDVDLSQQGIAARGDGQRPMVMFNAMVHPVSHYTLKGFIWYQGESNIGGHLAYPERLSKMVALWRSQWNLGELPFYFVEIAPFTYNNGLAAYLRESQWKAQKLIPNSAVVSTNDLVERYEASNIHPKNKYDVGCRLAYHALSKTYGMTGIHSDSPQYVSMEIVADKALITMTQVELGYNRLVGIEGFEICGADRVFHPAQAAIDGNFRVVVSSPEVTAPIAVRYAFGDFTPGNLRNVWELPLVPFRTDNF